MLSDKNRVAFLSKASLLHNIAEIRRSMSPHADMCAVVKANAYGHGAVEVSRILEADGVGWFAVATFAEAVELRRAGIQAKILILGAVPPGVVREAAELGLSITVHCADFADQVTAAMAGSRTRLPVHIKLDTGMSRLGYSTAGDDLERTCADIEAFCLQEQIIPEGMFSHFAASDSDAQFTETQIERYLRVRERLSAVPFRCLHIGNSGAVALDREPFNMVRAGIIMYGGSPDPANRTSLDLLPVMSVLGRVVQTKTLSQEETIGYSRTVTLPAGSRTAVVELGYADGVPRHMSNKGHFLINGKRARILGRVSMDRVILDIGNIETSAGEWALFFGQQDGNILSADEAALSAETISYELFCRVSARVPRIWI